MVKTTKPPATCGHHGRILITAMLEERGLDQDQLEIIACGLFHVQEGVEADTILDAIMSALAALPQIPPAYDA